jgi:hypothetical protein
MGIDIDRPAEAEPTTGPQSPHCRVPAFSPPDAGACGHAEVLPVGISAQK